MWFIPSFIITAWGIALIGLGRRGRRLDDHPICRGCGFDLVGSLPPGRRLGFAVPREALCPECGKALARRGAIEIGNRTRRPGLIAAGASITAIGVLGLLLSLTMSSSWPLVNRAFPASVLIWRGGDGDQAALRELVRRVASGRASDDRVKALVDRALRMQAAAPADRSSLQGWADIIEAARLRSLVTDAQWARYARQGMAELSCVLVPGEPGRYGIKLACKNRYGTPRPTPALTVVAALESTEFIESTGSARVDLFTPRPAPPGWIYLTESGYGGFVLLIGSLEAEATGPAPRVRLRFAVQAVDAAGRTVAAWTQEYEQPVK